MNPATLVTCGLVALVVMLAQPTGAALTRPRFMKKLQPKKANVGDSVVFEARFSGRPTPTISWFHGDVEIHPDRRFKMKLKGDLRALEITEVYPEDAGEYIAVAKNKAGKAVSSASLVISGNRAVHTCKDVAVNCVPYYCQWNDIAEKYCRKTCGKCTS